MVAASGAVVVAASGAHAGAKHVAAVVTMCGRNCFSSFSICVCLSCHVVESCKSNRIKRDHCTVAGFIVLVLVRGALSAKARNPQRKCASKRQPLPARAPYPTRGTHTVGHGVQARSWPRLRPRC